MTLLRSLFSSLFHLLCYLSLPFLLLPPSLLLFSSLFTPLQPFFHLYLSLPFLLLPPFPPPSLSSSSLPFLLLPPSLLLFNLSFIFISPSLSSSSPLQPFFSSLSLPPFPPPPSLLLFSLSFHLYLSLPFLLLLPLYSSSDFLFIFISPSLSSSSSLFTPLQSFFSSWSPSLPPSLQTQSPYGCY